ALAEQAHPRLRSLVLGMHDYVALAGTTPSSESISESMMEAGPVASLDALAGAAPALEALTVSGPRLVCTLAPPNLRQLAVEGGAMDGYPFAFFEPGPVRLPRLERLEHLAVNDDYRTFPITAPRLDPADVPALRELVFRGDYDIGNSGGSLFGFL